jgi:hypothetical protein
MKRLHILLGLIALQASLQIQAVSINHVPSFGLSTITLENSTGSTIPPFSTSVYPSVALLAGPNNLANNDLTAGLLPLRANLNPSLFDNGKPLVIQSTIDPSNYYTVTANFNLSVDASQFLIGASITFDGTGPTIAPLPYNLRFDFARLLQNITNLADRNNILVKFAKTNPTLVMKSSLLNTTSGYNLIFNQITLNITIDVSGAGSPPIKINAINLGFDYVGSDMFHPSYQDIRVTLPVTDDLRTLGVVSDFYPSTSN